MSVRVPARRLRFPEPRVAGLGNVYCPPPTEREKPEIVREEPRVITLQAPEEVRWVRAEAPSAGIDESLQLVGGDPFGRNAYTGLRVPTLASASLGNASPALNRYLFLLATATVPRGKRGRLRGYRQLVTMGANVGESGAEGYYRPVEFTITDPIYRPFGGSISWHMQDLGAPSGNIQPNGSSPITYATAGAPTTVIAGLDNLGYQIAGGPALLYQSITLPVGSAYYVQLEKYLPPNGGQPYGVPLLEGGFSSFNDLRTPWQASQAWHSLDVEIQGPKTIGFFASVYQPDHTVSGYALPNPSAGAYSPEEQFVSAVPTAVYWRVGGSIIMDL